MMKVLVFLSMIVGVALASDCSSGDTAYMCANLDTCWRDLGFGSRDDLKYLCEMQGLPTGPGGGGSPGGVTTVYVEITEAPRNITVAPGAQAQFACTADAAIKVIIIPLYEADSAAFEDRAGLSPSTQKVIQVIDEAYQQHEGWYICIAFGANGNRAEYKAYLEIRDICARNDCSPPKVCQPDMYAGDYECVCPGDCDNTFDPVCASDCGSYFNECAMKKDTCEKGLEGVYVVSRGLCTFSPQTPYFTESPQGGTFQAGRNTFSCQASVPHGQGVEYFWYFGDERIGEGAELVTDLSTSQSGEWRVEARSCHGLHVVSHRYTITVQGGRCNRNCGRISDPVCASDCNTYINKCVMEQQTCEQGLEGVYVVSRVGCSFTPVSPYFTKAPIGGMFNEGWTTFSALVSVPAGQSVQYHWYFGSELIGEGGDLVTQLLTGQSGVWSVRASSCHERYEVLHTFTITVQSGGVVEPTEHCCKVYGDPHIVTFDGLRYDYMGSCSYIIAEDVAGQWLIYGTYKPCGDKTKQLSCIVGITVFFENEMVQFLRMYRINYRGQEFMVPVGTTKYLGQIRIENTAMKYYIYLGNTGVRVMWDGITTSETCLPTRCASGVQGMCGNADCNPNNDFAGFAGSSAFGNSWAIGTNCELEPDDGSLPGQRKRPCDYVPYEQKVNYEARCNRILNMAVFSDCISRAGFDRASLFANCMFDMCSGLTLGGGCADRGDRRCDAEIEMLIVEAIARGMTRAEAEAKYRTKSVDPACMMGFVLVNDCSAWGIVIGNSWRQMAFCPTDEELTNIVVCPTAYN